MGQWSEVSQLQNQIEKAEAEFKTLCDKFVACKNDCLKKRTEIKELYEKQDAMIQSVLGPRNLASQEKIILESTK